MKQITGQSKKTALMNVAILLGGAILLSGCVDNQVDEELTPADIIHVATVNTTIAAVQLVDTLQGRVKPLRSANIHPQISGIITQRLFKQGDTLQKGDSLFQIDPQSFAIDVEVKQAALLKSQADLGLRQSNLDRLSKLVKTNATSKEAFDIAQFNQKMAAAGVNQNRAELHRSQLQLNYTTVTAPISGTIGEVISTEGVLVSPTDNKPMAVIQQIDSVYIDVRQTVAGMRKLRQLPKNVSVSIQPSDSRDDDITGHILFSGISVDENTGDFIVRIEAENPNQRLLPGMFVRVLIPLPLINAVEIPQQSVHRRGNGEPYVNVLAEGKAKQRQVTIAGLKDGQYIVTTGLNAQETVIVTGNEKLRPGVVINATRWSSQPDIP